MLNRIIILLFLLPSFVLAQTSKMLNFSFTLSKAATVSAGIYKGEKLIRTLFNNRQYPAGSFTEKFAPLTDNLDTIKDVTGMTVKYISNNITDEWEGVIGNTSNYSTGDSVYKSYEHIQCMVFSGDNGFFARGYSEESESNGRFKIANPNTHLRIFKNQKTGMNPKFCVTDGITVYFGGIDNYAKYSGFSQSDFVYGVSAKDFTETTFANGISYKSGIGRTYKSTIDMMHSKKGNIKGMAVQRNGRFLFVAHSFSNELHILDKTTGELVRILVIPSVSNLCVDNNDNLWVQTGVILTKYQLDKAANLSDPLLSITDLVLPLAMAVSPANLLTVIDGGNSQQIKAFDNKTGLPAWVFGEKGGYANGAEVRNDKFYFSDTTKADFRGLRTYIAYQPDGSFWVGDVCNSRSQHYTANRKFIDRIMFLRRVYNIGLDQNDSTRLFADYLEFKIDYTKPLKPNNGSWELVKNWGFGFNGTTENQQARLNKVTTLSNGRTYVLYNTRATKNIAELMSNGFVRFCKTSPKFSSGKETLYPDGSMRFAPVGVHTVGGKLTWSRRNLTGFNPDGDPQYGPLTTTVSVPYSGIEAWANNITNFGEVTNNGKLISFLGTVPNNKFGQEFTKQFHLGSIDIATSTWDWLTANSTFYRYRGPFPTDGYFDIGNGVIYAAKFHKVIDNYIFHQYNGEFYKGSQTNYWNIFYDNGLMIHQFGTRRNMGIPQVSAQYGMAGNAFSGSITRGDDGYYVYHNDESVHSGVHRWKIGNVNSLQLKEAPVTYIDGPADRNIIDLMGDLLIDTVLVNGTAGWVRYPAVDDTTALFTKWWEVRTSANSYDRFSKPDIFIRYRHPTSSTVTDTATVSKDLGNNDLSNWTFKGQFNYAEGSGTLYSTTMTGINNNYTGSSIQILDDNNKVILKFGYFSNATTGVITMVANGIVIKTWENFDAKIYKEFWRAVSFEVTSTTALFKFGEFSANVPLSDPTANRNKPKTFRVYNWTKIKSIDQIVSFKDLKLIK